MFHKPIISINVTGSGFTVQTGKKVIENMDWKEIVKITAFKRDLFTTDLICMQMTKDERNFIEVNEEMNGFEEFNEAILKFFFGIDENWQTSIASPPFATNFKTLWLKHR